jgi:arylsulfatase A-like enzyme
MSQMKCVREIAKPEFVACGVRLGLQAVWGIGLSLILGASAQAAARPNILFIMADDHGYQAMSCYGSRVNQTPNLDRIAREGMRFDRCYVTNSICGPCRAVILTGKYSHLNGFVRNGNRFNGAQQNVAKLLRSAGYQTAVIGKWHLASEPTGFDYWHILKGQGPYYNPNMLVPGGSVQHTGYTTEIITDETLKWLEQRETDQPFFLLYWHKAPHRNWQPGPKQLHLYDDVDIPEPETLFDDYSNRASPASNQTMTVAEHLTPNDLKLTPQRGLNEEQTRLWDEAYGPKNTAFKEANLQGVELIRWKYQRYVKDYLRCVDSVDENVGRVLDYLEESGLDENTIVVYSSDQGWYLGEHGWYDKRWMYEESFRTPLLIRWPGKIKPGSVNQDFVMNLDFAETFLEAAGVNIPDDMQGRSLVPVLEGKTPEDWRQSLYYHYYEFPGAHSVAKHNGVRTDRYKLIHYYDLGEWELFDLQNDPHELKSVYGQLQYAQVQKELLEEMERLRKQYQDDGSVVNFDAEAARNVKLKQVVRFSPKGSAVTEGKVLLHLDSSDAVDPANKPITLGGWCRPDELNGVLVAQGGESLGYALALVDGKVVFVVRDHGARYSIEAGGVNRDEWTHVAATLNPDGDAQIYLNGQPVGGAKRLSLLGGRPSDGLDVGVDAGSLVGPFEKETPFVGELRDVRVYWGTLPKRQWNQWVQ